MVERVLIAVGVSFLILLLGGVPLLKAQKDDVRWTLGAQFFVAISIAAAVMWTIAYVRADVPAFPPGDATTWPFWFAPVAALLGFTSVTVRRGAPAWALRGAFVLGGVFLICRPLLEHTWTGFGGWLRVAGLVAAILSSWYATERLQDRANDTTIPLAFAFAATATGAGLAYVSTITIGLLVATLALALGAAAVWDSLRPGNATRLTIATTFPLYGFSVVMAHGYAEFGPVPTLLLLVAPVALWVGQLVATRPSPVRALVRGGVACAVVLAAVAIADSQSTPEAEVSDDGTYVPY